MLDTIPVRADERFDAARVAAVPARRRPDRFDPEHLEVEQFPAGQSNLTYLLRVGRLGGGAAAAAARAGAAARARHGARVPHPRAPAPELSAGARGRTCCARTPTVIGAPFYVMERRRGLVLDQELPADWVADPALHRAIAESLVRVLVDLHAVDWRAAGLGEIGRPDGYLQRQVSGWIDRYVRARTDEVPEFDALAAWLTAQPARVAAGHGDPQRLQAQQRAARRAGSASADRGARLGDGHGRRSAVGRGVAAGVLDGAGRDRADGRPEVGHRRARLSVARRDRRPVRAAQRPRPVAGLRLLRGVRLLQARRDPAADLLPLAQGQTHDERFAGHGHVAAT